MNIASLELCKELYELSGWKGEDCYQEIQKYNPYTGKLIKNASGINSERPYIVNYAVSLAHINDQNRGEELITPRYDLGYLLRKLPPTSKIVKVSIINGETYGAIHVYKVNEPNLTINADTPEDCAAKLAIELIHQRIIKV
jgi:hypothetical protein